MPKSQSDYIREELERDFNAPAAAIVARILKKGLRCNVQNVYLGQHIINILTSHPEGLSDRDLTGRILLIQGDSIKKAGYTSRATDFLTVVCEKLHDMVEKGHIAKNGLQYKLHGLNAELYTRTALELALQQVAEVVAEASDLDVLREAVTDFARAKGIADPELFPDTLIRQRREFIQAQTQYFTLFESGSNGSK